MLPAVDPGAHQHEVIDQPGLGEREVERDVASERDADDVRALDPETLEEPGHVCRIDEGPVGERRLADIREGRAR